MVDTPEVITGAENVIWDLSPFYSSLDDPQIEADMEAIRAEVSAFAEKYRGKVGTLNAAEMSSIMKQQEDIYDRVVRLSSYAFLNFATDSDDHIIGALAQKMTQFSAEIQQQLVFATLEWQAVDDDHAQAIINDPAIGKYKHNLEIDMLTKPYTLSEPEEQVMMAMGVNGRSAWTRFFSKLTSAMRLTWEGEQVTMTEVLSKLYDPEREVRKRAADAITAGLAERSMELTYIFNVLAADKQTNDTLRGYPNWITSRNLSNEVADEIVDALVSTVTASYDLVARHYNLKRLLLGLDELTDYDRYAPLPLESGTRQFQWDEARQIVLNAFGKFSPRMAEVAGYFFDESWIHAPVQPHKRGGAFAASTTPTVHPYVFVNFMGKARDVSTLAHELGHGIHMYLAGQSQGLLGADTPLTTAEMASVFGEMLVFSDLIGQESDPEVRLAMLVDKIEDTFATVFRQTSMNRFEDAMHTEYREHGERSPEDFNRMWLETQQAMFGDSVTIREDYGSWWSYIPHFLHTPGYVYAYAFGELLVLALFELYKEQGDAFVEKYMAVLSAGGSDYPDKILAQAGVNLNDPTFWQKGIDVIRKFVEQEEALAREIYPEKFA